MDCSRWQVSRPVRRRLCAEMPDHSSTADLEAGAMVVVVRVLASSRRCGAERNARADLVS